MAEEYRTRYENPKYLAKLATVILHSNGLSARGKPFRFENPRQIEFERNMQLGAYCTRRRR